MAKALFTTAQMATMRSLRNLDEDIAGCLRSELFSGIKAGFGIPDDHKIKVELDDTMSSVYSVILRKKTGDAYTLTDDGVWDRGAGGATPTGPRWFKVPRALVSDGVIDAYPFSAGLVGTPEGVTLPAHGDDTDLPMLVASNGELYIRLSKAASAGDADTQLRQLMVRLLAMTS